MPATAISGPEIDLLATEFANSQSKTQNLRRNGKIARLPKATRDMLNRMLDDGLPARVIIDELGDAGKGLNAQNLTNWVQGGYQDYLKQQAELERAKALVQSVIDLLREGGEPDLPNVRHACNYVAALQLFQAIREHGDLALKNLFQSTPSKYLNVIHALCHQSDSILKIQKHRLQQQLLAARSDLAAPSSPIKANQAPAENSANCKNPAIHPSNNASADLAAPSSQIKVNQAPAENPDNCNNPAIHPSNNAPADLAAPSSLIKVNQAPAENPDNCKNPRVHESLLLPVPAHQPSNRSVLFDNLKNII
ncbi:MAG TPA: hypothetical protein VG167_03660 [Verrucomicrobiae bacterium]|nr:hypothetical protein [Verrucomicrobiae bacterium]